MYMVLWPTILLAMQHDIDFPSIPVSRPDAQSYSRPLPVPAAGMCLPGRTLEREPYLITLTGIHTPADNAQTEYWNAEYAVCGSEAPLEARTTSIFLSRHAIHAHLDRMHAFNGVADFTQSWPPRAHAGDGLIFPEPEPGMVIESEDYCGERFWLQIQEELTHCEITGFRAWRYSRVSEPPVAGFDGAGRSQTANTAEALEMLRQAQLTLRDGATALLLAGTPCPELPVITAPEILRIMRTNRNKQLGEGYPTPPDPVWLSVEDPLRDSTPLRDYRLNEDARILICAAEHADGTTTYPVVRAFSPEGPYSWRRTSVMERHCTTYQEALQFTEGMLRYSQRLQFALFRHAVHRFQEVVESSHYKESLADSARISQELRRLVAPPRPTPETATKASGNRAPERKNFL